MSSTYEETSSEHSSFTPGNPSSSSSSSSSSFSSWSSSSFSSSFSPPSPSFPDFNPDSSTPSDDNNSDESPAPKSSKDSKDRKSGKSSKAPSPRSSTPIASKSPSPRSSSSSKDALTSGDRTEGKSSHKSSHKSSNNDDSGSSDVSPGVIIGVAVGVGLFIILLISLIALCSKKRKRKEDPMSYYSGDNANGPKGGNYYNGSQKPNWHNNNAGGGPGVNGWPPMSSENMTTSGSFTGPPLPPPSPSLAFGFSKSTFTYDELAAATGGFAHGNLLGQGGFGYVHKGVLPNGKEVAVKSLKVGSGQGEREFMAEVEIISRVHHRHLVSLVGFCIAGGQRMLVYEFVPNNTLEHHLHGKDLPVMDWPTRLRIAIGSAKGLAYLHEDCHPKIIHRDIKSANILIDANFEAMVADFGLAKLSSDTNTHVSTRVMGTFGYLAPEYASSGKLTEKSDVFSYGVMLLEIITGRRPVDASGELMEDSLVDWARPLCLKAMTEGAYEALADPRLEKDYDAQEMACMVACAAACIRHSAKRRPKMSQVVRALEGDVSMEDLNDGVKPGQSSYFGSGTSSDYDASSYSADMKRFRKVALESREYTSSDYGGTSEYGLNPSATSSDNSQKPSQASSPNLQPNKP